MFINNLTGKTIKDITFDGFWFSIPTGVSVCWDKFGEHLLKNAYPETGSGVNPVIRATASQWKGDRYVDVRRFELNSELIPKRADLIKLAKQRGVSRDQIELWQEDETIDGQTIAQVINELDVPEHIKYPVPEAEQVDSTTDEAEQAALDAAAEAAGAPAETPGDADPKPPVTPTVPPADAPTAPVAPVTGGAKKTAAKKTTAAKRVPRTRSAPVK